MFSSIQFNNTYVLKCTQSELINSPFCAIVAISSLTLSRYRYIALHHKIRANSMQYFRNNNLVDYRNHVCTTHSHTHTHSELMSQYLYRFPVYCVIEFVSVKVRKTEIERLRMRVHVLHYNERPRILDQTLLLFSIEFERRANASTQFEPSA